MVRALGVDSQRRVIVVSSLIPRRVTAEMRIQTQCVVIVFTGVGGQRTRNTNSLSKMLSQISVSKEDKIGAKEGAWTLIWRNKLKKMRDDMLFGSKSVPVLNSNTHRVGGKSQYTLHVSPVEKFVWGLQ
jgi:hypothetical protein